MKKTLFALACAAAVFCACDKEEAPKPIGTVETPFTGTVKAGIPESVTVTGTGFEVTDSLYLAWADGAEGVEAYTITETEIKFGVDAYSAAKGKAVKAYLYREGKTLELTGEFNVTEPTAEDGFVIKDKALVAALKAHNGDVAAMFGPCNLLDVEAAAALVKDTQCDNEWGLLAVDGNGAKSYEGLEVFANLGAGLKTMQDQEYGNFICWGCGEIEEIDFSNWNAYIQVRAASCPKLKKVVLGPNMKGGDFDKSPIEHFDMHLCKGADWVMNLGNNVDPEAYPDYQGLKYANLARTYIAGGTYGVDFNHYRGSGNVKGFKFAPGAEIHVDNDLISHNWSAEGVILAIKAAWKAGATVIVHDLNNYESSYTVAAYTENPDALNPTCGEEGCNGMTF